MLTVTPTKTQDIKGITTSPSPTSTPSDVLREESTITPAAKIEITHTPSPTQKSTDASFIYPNSNSLGGDLYESTDSPNTITAWYKEKINKENMNATSFVTTNTNDNIKNVLAFANEHKNMQVEITKNASDSKTKIVIR